MKKIGLIIMMLLFLGKGLFAQSAKTSNDTLKFTGVKGEISIFLNLMHVAGMDTIYTGRPVTIFAPENKAFESLPAGTIDSLAKPGNRQLLTTFLNIHIIPGKLTSKAIGQSVHQNNSQTILITLSGNKLIAKINANRNITLTDEHGGQNVVSQFDIPYFNTTFFIVK